jgi:hypothetical protein
MLCATFPELDANKLPFVALTKDFDVAEFEQELPSAGLLSPQETG